ncbi:MAG: phosphatidate cytidylyltransferase [Bacilli bacterium]|nr:phosphatidate cytidylyltransferase [Bacilli bacterium]MDD4282599.1 phosphatidate cytidylyltransferase [Bacilli bacterium]MDD4719228.1 phosphatidate cytidylyltransferase [Bacilli bacterium]
MKTRIISAIIVLLIVIPIIITGNSIYNIVIYILSLAGLKEFINIKETKKKVPDFIKFISFIIMTLIVIGSTTTTELVYTMDYRIIAGLFLVCLLPTVLYHDNSKYSIHDAFYLIGGLFFLGLSFHLLIVLRKINFFIIIYLFLITIMTDTFAYFTGYLIGRNKLLEVISPKKTWEGLIGGTIMGVFVSFVFYTTVINSNIDIATLLIATTFLSLVGQYGDLVFSGIKRYYGKKDFSNLMPGHGGILDRLDSIIFVVLGYMFFITIL